MKQLLIRLSLLLCITFCFSCSDKPKHKVSRRAGGNVIAYAKGLELRRYEGFSTVTVRNPWPGATQDYHYVLYKKGVKVPDSLRSYVSVQVPIKSVVVTSTTHIPSLDMLGVTNSLVGFPNCQYVSSPRVRSLIDAGKIRELGSNQNLNTEVLLALKPDVIVGYGIDNHNPALDNLQRSGLNILLNGDWNEESPLGKAEWLKFFGALYDKDALADELFGQIEKDYKATAALAQNTTHKPTVMAGAIYENQWYLPHGNSWGARFIAEAGGRYLWAGSQGTGSLALPFETVFQKAHGAEVWIGPGQFTSLSEMLEANANYAQFKAFQTKKVYSFSAKKGATGGIIFYELAPNRPDLVLKDMVKILHPELLPHHQLFFFENLH